MLFVNLNEQLANGEKQQDEDTQRRIRVQAMKDFRRRQRDRRPLCDLPSKRQRTSTSPKSQYEAEITSEMHRLLKAPSSSSINASQIFNYLLEPYGRRTESYYAWMADIPALCASSKSLSYGFLALCAISIAREHKDNNARNLADIAYQLGLRQLRRDISQPAIAKHDATLYTCLVFERFLEFAQYMQPGHIKAHYNGKMKLIEHRGPDSFRTPSGLKIFGLLQPGIAGVAIYQQCSTIMSQPEWQGIWKNIPSSDPAYLDSLVYGLTPSLAELVARLKGFPTTSGMDDWLEMERELLALLGQFEEVDREVILHETRTQGKGKGTGITITPASDQQIFSGNYEFPSPHASNLLIYVWCHTAMIYNMLRQCRDALRTLSRDASGPLNVFGLNSTASFFPEPIYLTESSQTVHDYDLRDSYDYFAYLHASHICKGIDYCLRHNPHTYGRMQFVFALSMAIEVFRDLGTAEPEVKWTTAAMSDLISGKIQRNAEVVEPSRTDEILSEHWVKLTELLNHNITYHGTALFPARGDLLETSIGLGSDN